jgi:hypothetical protein
VRGILALPLMRRVVRRLGRVVSRFAGMRRLIHNWWFWLAACLVASSLVLIAVYWADGVGSENPATPSDMNDRIAERGSLTFRSCGGQWIGTDCDTDIVFLPNQAAHLIEYQYGGS